MRGTIGRAWTELLRPLIFRPHRIQVAALCLRPAATAGREVLLITSRDTGRWILPKGWPIDGLSAPDAALREAWEEAGVVRARVSPAALGSYGYNKRLAGGAPVRVDVQVFMADEIEMQDEFPESAERQRAWVTPEEAARRVDEPGLKDILRGL